MRAPVTGTRSIDQMVEAAIWLMVQGDRSGAEELLAQVLRIDPTHERARQAMRSTGAQTSPGQEAPKAPIPHQTQPVIPPGTIRVTEATPLEPLPALQRPVPPGLMRRHTLPGTGDEAQAVLERREAPVVGADTVWESATVTCCHCGAVVILNPNRKRPRGYCAKCDAYHCDNPGCGSECRPFDKFLDLTQAKLAAHEHYFADGICATCGELEIVANAATNPFNWQPNVLTVATS